MTSSAQVADSENVVASPVRRRGRPARSSTSQSNIRLNPKTYAGMGSRKRNLTSMNRDARSFHIKFGAVASSKLILTLRFGPYLKLSLIFFFLHQDSFPFD
ncbi:hypothetical protein YC2023_041228 [Brassica napus]